MDNYEFHDNRRIWFLYKKHLNIQLKYKSALMITCLVEANHISEKFMYSVVYVFNYKRAKQSLWEEIVTIKNENRMPWVLCRDFNCMWFGFEKIRDNRPSPTAMEDFNKCLLEVEFQDLKWWGSKCTGWNQQMGKGKVENKIDRALVNGEWINLFPKFGY